MKNWSDLKLNDENKIGPKAEQRRRISTKVFMLTMSFNTQNSQLFRSKALNNLSDLLKIKFLATK